mgnify:CR=1 FL=1
MVDIDGELIAYIGGLDMTMGRYDDQSHPLFRQSTADDETDFYQYTIAKPVYGTYVCSECIPGLTHAYAMVGCMACLPTRVCYNVYF